MIKKLKAFTLMEVTVVMLITAVVIAITYTAFHMIHKTYADYCEKQDKVAAFNVLDKLLKKDFLLADAVLSAEDGLQIITASGQISYSFQDKYVLRNQFDLQTDTFKMEVRELKTFFEKQSANNGDTVDRVNVQFIMNGTILPMSYLKTYSAQQLF